MSIPMDRTHHPAYRSRDDFLDYDRSFRDHYRDYPTRSTRPSRSHDHRPRREEQFRDYYPYESSSYRRSPSYYNSSSALPYNGSDREDYGSIPTNYRRESASRAVEDASYPSYRDDEYRSSSSTCSLTFLSMRTEPYSSSSERYNRNDSNHRSDISIQRNNAVDYHHPSSINSRSSHSSSTGSRREHSYRSSRDYPPIESSRYSSDYQFYPSIKRSRSRYDIDDELRPIKRRDTTKDLENYHRY